MKKIIILLSILLLVSASLFSAPSVRTMKGLDNYFLEFDGNNLLKSEKVEIYNDMKQNAIFASLTNLVVGFGAGSNFVGEKLGRNLGIALDIAGFSVMTVGVGMFVVDIAFLGALSYASGETPLFADIMFGSLIAGGSILAVSHIFQAIMPFVHVSKYNAKLREYLGLTKADIKMAILPSDNFGITAIASIQY